MLIQAAEEVPLLSDAGACAPMSPRWSRLPAKEPPCRLSIRLKTSGV